MRPDGATRRFGAGVLAVVALGLIGLGPSACGRRDDAAAPDRTAVAFAILSAQGQASSAPLWQPLLDDMSRSIGVPVTAHFAADYGALVDDMERGTAQAAWLSARPAIDAVERARAEVIARTVNPDGQDSYNSVLIVKRGSGVTLQEVLACGKRLDYGVGDARSTSATLAPRAFLFSPRGIDPETCFSAVRADNHERHAREVASGILDVAATNTVTLRALALQNPTIAAEVEEIWRSPALPEGGIVLREDMDPALKEKIRGFFLSYGRGTDVEAERQRRVLAGLNYSRFVAADDDYLDPVREILADEALATARAAGDRRAAAAAERELTALRAKREVQP
jgi:phosphonate transport system substrate-binding protein